MAATSECDKFKMAKPIHMQASNIYQCKDGKWYHIHQSFNAGPTMKMLGVEESDATTEEAQKIYIEKVKQWNSATLDTTANDQYMQAGCICNTVQEFFAHPHVRGGTSFFPPRQKTDCVQTKIIEKEPVASITALKAPKTPWPKVTSTDYRPLAGIRVVDLTRAVAGPTVTKLLAVLGADVIKIGSTSIPDVYICLPDVNTGKRDIDMNLKTPEGKAAFRKIIKDADVLVDGYRPHALAKLGFDSVSLREINPSLIFSRENCYGHIGPLAYRSGWQQIADCFAGLSWMQGEFLGLNEPVVPLLRMSLPFLLSRTPYSSSNDLPANADYQTGVLGAAFIIQALQKRANTDVTFDVDISLLQYNIWYQRLGAYNPEQNKALLARNPSFKARHYDEMGSMFRKVVEAIKESRPGLLENPEFYSKMSGKEWNIDEDLSILAPPFDFSRSEISYLCPSGRRGWSNNNPEWITIN